MNLFFSIQSVIRNIFVSLFLFGLICCFSKAVAQDSCQLKVSILTCGTGGDLYASYGHSAVRIRDICSGTDVVYNYGTFNFGDPDFYTKFTRGKLSYYLNDETFEGFIETYQEEGRRITEQVLKLQQTDAVKVQRFLQENLREENKYYRYDFLFDNCSTRIRDLFTKLFGTRLEWGYVIANDSMSFRTVLDYYERNLHWERYGINLLMSHQVDDKMSSYQSMFLPDYLEKGFEKASLDGSKLVGTTQDLLPQKSNFETSFNEPKYYSWALLIILVLLARNKTIKPYLLYFDMLLFMILGLLGCLMLFMWLGTEHKVCAWNRNLLWAFPLHLVFAARLPSKNDMVKQYAKYAALLLIASGLYNLFAHQKYMDELFPLLILVYIRLTKYSSSYLGMASRI